MVRTDALARKLRGLDIAGLMFLPGGVKERRAEANLVRERIENEGNATQRWWSGPEHFTQPCIRITSRQISFPPPKKYPIPFLIKKMDFCG